VHQILNPFLDLKALATVGRCNTFFEEYWQYVLKQNIIRVPEGCPTINQAMDLAVIFTERNECTGKNPVKVEVGEGEHEMVGVAGNTYAGQITHVNCSNIAIVGKGKCKTTVLGGFYVNGKQNVNIEQLTTYAHGGTGLFCEGSGTNVAVMECCFQRGKCGLVVRNGANGTATQCDFVGNDQYGVICGSAHTRVRLNDCTIHHNGTGVCAYDHVAMDLCGTKTDVHSSNKGSGIFAIQNAKVNIHLPSQHNTIHDNGVDNRVQDDGGSIANINADGTFTHVEEVDVNW
jgi:hypothetical protein